jgi:glycosyltransferase involved in cell wall biosynthesis
MNDPQLTPTLPSLDGIRIARISTVPFFVVTQLKQQIAMLGELGAHVTVVSKGGPGFEVFEKMRGIHCEVIDIERAISPFRDVLALIHLYLFFRKNRTQIAHSTTPKAGLLTAIAAYLACVPIRLHTYTGQPWVNSRGVKGWLTRSSDILVGRLNTCCYADSISQRQFLIDNKILNAERLFVIGAGSLAGVDLQRFNLDRFSLADRESTRISLGIPETAPVLLFVSRITEDKGVRELLRAFQILKAVFTELHLVLVGPLDDKSGMAGAIAKVDITAIKDVHSIGFSITPEVYMAIADVLCLPSYREGFGTVVIEAAAMGLPTVGSDIYGLTDAVLNEETGLLVPPRDAEALALAISRLLENSSLRISMGEAARLRAHSLFDEKNINLQMAQAYVSLLHQTHTINIVTH